MNDDVHATLPAYRDALINDLNVLVADAQALLRDVASDASGRSAVAHADMKRRVEDVRQRMGVLREGARQRTRQFTEATDAYVHEHPWQCIGTVAVLSAAIGAISTLAGSRRH